MLMASTCLTCKDMFTMTLCAPATYKVARHRMGVLLCT